MKRIAVIECGVGGAENSYKNIVDWLDRLGVRQGCYPVVHSPLNFTRHINISLAGDLPGESYPLSPEIGEGALFYGPKTYVIAPPSTTIDGEYKLQQGDFNKLPVLTVHEILNLLDLPIIPSWVKEGSKPLSDYELFGIPARVMALIRGEDIENYQDPMALEQAIMISLIKKGYSDSQILSIFLNYPIAGKFSEIQDFNTDAGLKWLGLLIDISRDLLNTNQSMDHQIARETISWAESTPWPGRTGSTDQAVLIAHAKIAFRRGQLIYGASVREIAELSGITRTTASTASNRLIDAGMLTRINPSGGFQAAIYDLISDGHNRTISLCTDCHIMHTHDAFRWKGLGKSAALVWHALDQNDSLTVTQLVDITGKHQSTIRRKLRTMASLQDLVTGRLLPMVREIEQKGANRWRALDVNLDRVAIVNGTDGTGRKQRIQHKREQKSYEQRLRRKRNKNSLR